MQPTNLKQNSYRRVNDHRLILYFEMINDKTKKNKKNGGCWESYNDAVEISLFVRGVIHFHEGSIMLIYVRIVDSKKKKEKKKC